MPPLRDVNEDAASMCSGDPLSIYSYNKQKNRWTRTSYARTTTDTEGNFKCAASPPSQIKILTWNVDFFSPNAAERLDCILSYIQHTLFSCSEDQHAPEPCALLLQEVESEVLSVLLASSWLREHFQMTPISNFNWPNRSHYGCIMIVSKDISIVRARNLVFKGSHQSRAALIMDFLLSAPLSEEVASNEVLKGQQGEGNCNSVKGASEGAILGEDVESPRPNPFVIFRVANVHLESLPQGADERRRQLALVAQALQARDGYGEQNLLGGMVCGDMNSICASDRDLHLEVGLIDAHLSDVSTGAAEDDMDAFTWGFQPAGTYPPGRLDKILHTRAHIPAAENSRSVVFTVDAPTRVGVGLKIKDDDYASSHVGLSTRLTLNSSIPPWKIVCRGRLYVMITCNALFPSVLPSSPADLFPSNQHYHQIIFAAMRFTLTTFVALLAAVGINAQDLTIITPSSPVQCLPLLLSWSGGTAPYFLTVLPGGQPSASPLVDLGEQQGTSVTWVVNIAAGTSVGLQIRDSTGLVQNSAPFIIQNSSDSSCIGQAVSTSAGSSASATSGSTSSGSAASTTGASSSGSSSGATSKASSSSTSTSSSSSSTSNAGMPLAQIAPAGVIGALAAIFIA